MTNVKSYRSSWFVVAALAAVGCNGNAAPVIDGLAASTEAQQYGVFSYRVEDHTVRLLGRNAEEVGTLTLSQGLDQAKVDVQTVDGFYGESEVIGRDSAGQAYTPASGDPSILSVVETDGALADFFAQEGVHFLALTSTDSTHELQISADTTCAMPVYVSGDDINGNYAVPACNPASGCYEVQACWNDGISNYRMTNRGCSCPAKSCTVSGQRDLVQRNRTCNIGISCTHTTSYKGCTTL